eukprot:scaffold7998_cov417-Prasinococcus_capsulatus_cf.AAC.14
MLDDRHDILRVLVQRNMLVTGRLAPQRCVVCPEEYRHKQGIFLWRASPRKQFREQVQYPPTVVATVSPVHNVYPGECRIWRARDVLSTDDRARTTEANVPPAIVVCHRRPPAILLVRPLSQRVSKKNDLSA